MKFDSLLLNGILLILILLLWFTLFFFIKKDKYNNFFIKLGGKIGRISFLVNDILLHIMAAFWLFFVNQSSIPVFSFHIAAFIFTIEILRYNNIYKRLYSISNNRKFSLSLIIGSTFFVKFCNLADITQASKAISTVFCISLLLIPEKRAKKEKD